ncbi:MAG: two-component sensor kinase [Candidatus Scalindua rubra]|uniref:histidine kinase n=1 Tax=Candidatus Scalindua rubra TaxID=1872076 RepID=A0A1E3XF98_9BACT|nr:MAG: two-component sensor kinase [Candidatus Scalindua rubra]
MAIFGKTKSPIIGVSRPEQELSASEQKYQYLCDMVLSSIPSSILMFDKGLKVIFANKNFLEKSRQRERETIGKKIDEVLPTVILNYTLLPERIKEVFESGRGYGGRRMTYRSPGLPSRVYYYSLVPLKDTSDQTDSVMLLMDDITEQVRLGEEVRRAERHLASVVESASDIVVSMKPDGTILTWNSAAERISGFTNRDTVGKYLSGFCPKERKKEMESTIKDLSIGRRVKQVEMNMISKGKKEIYLSWIFSHMRDDDGKIIGIVGIGRDLTERRELEAQLIQSAKLASVGVLAGGIAHEIRNPLGVCSSAAQILLESPYDKKLQKECSEKIYSGIGRASYIIENLLRFARPSEGRLEPIKVNDVIDETITLIAEQIKLQRIMIEKKLSSDLPFIEGNSNLLKQVFLNMMLNAANAMEDGGTLTIKTEIFSSKDVNITFSDTGCGIPKENLDKIFDPFFTTMPVGKGTGLGLSISYSIIIQHNGSINVRSTSGKGSTFVIKLPLK